jgi:hypothetical protein
MLGSPTRTTDVSTKASFEARSATDNDGACRKSVSMLKGRLVLDRTATFESARLTRCCCDQWVVEAVHIEITNTSGVFDRPKYILGMWRRLSNTAAFEASEAAPAALTTYVFDIAGVCARIRVGVSINRRLAGVLRTGTLSLTCNSKV